MNLLFICSRNQWRSPTAEHIFGSDEYNTRSAGTAASARIRVTEKLIQWADIIFVMEKKHREQLAAKFSEPLTDKLLFILDIPDEYQFMDDELIDILKRSVRPLLDKL